MNRETLLQTLRQPQVWDVIVIGGGATGLGAAVDAASRGLKTLLLESHDFAKGTSSRSTKLVHGGVRYLAQGNISLVQHALTERGLLRQNAPHLVNTLGFVIPGYEWWSTPFYGIGMKVYDFLSGKLNLASSTPISKQKALEYVPMLRTEGLLGGVLYYDAQFDDTRLAIALARTLLDLGGTLINYAPVTGLLKNNARVSGVKAVNSETGETFELNAKVIINATGVFVDAVRQMDDANSRKMVSPSQGSHLVVDKSFLAGDYALMIPKTDDGRVLFAVPWHDKVILGTTDNAVDTTDLEPKPKDEEVDFILRTAGRYLTRKPTRDDVRASYAGLRPLVKADKASSTKQLSRDHTIRISESGLITITGGKWTTYRKMGEDVINRALEVGQLGVTASKTESLKLHGHSTETQAEPFQVYGSDSSVVKTMPGNEIKLHSRLPHLESQVRYAARFELARTIEDVLSRRTRALLLDAKASLEAAPRVGEILAEELGYSSDQIATQLEQYRQVCSGYILT
jgi:glycerol-3-phosphate dehydrogenase